MRAVRYLRALLRRLVGPLGRVAIASLRGGRARVRAGEQSDGYGAHQRLVARFVGRVQPGKLHFPINRLRAGRSGREDASRNTATFAVSREHRAGQPLPRKIMPDDEYYTNPAGLFGWFHGVPVGLPFTCKKMIFFFVRCNHQIRLFHIPQMVDRFLRYSQNFRLLIMGYLSTPMGSCSATDQRSMR